MSQGVQFNPSVNVRSFSLNPPMTVPSVEPFPVVPPFIPPTEVLQKMNGVWNRTLPAKIFWHCSKCNYEAMYYKKAGPFDNKVCDAIRCNVCGYACENQYELIQVPSFEGVFIVRNFLNNYKVWENSITSVSAASSTKKFVPIAPSNCQEANAQGKREIAARYRKIDGIQSISLKKKKRRGQYDKSTPICRHCNQTQTTEWRKGPLGQRTLCNACGLRFARSQKGAEKGLSVKDRMSVQIKFGDPSTFYKVLSRGIVHLTNKEVKEEAMKNWFVQSPNQQGAFFDRDLNK
jgi:hypothetical protein